MEQFQIYSNVTYFGLGGLCSSWSLSSCTLWGAQGPMVGRPMGGAHPHRFHSVPVLSLKESPFCFPLLPADHVVFSVLSLFLPIIVLFSFHVLPSLLSPYPFRFSRCAFFPEARRRIRKEKSMGPDGAFLRREEGEDNTDTGIGREVSSLSFYLYCFSFLPSSSFRLFCFRFAFLPRCPVLCSVFVFLLHYPVSVSLFTCLQPEFLFLFCFRTVSSYSFVLIHFQ